MVQRRVLGTNIDLTGLGVVTPNPSLDLNEVGLPEELAWRLYEPFIVSHMVRNGYPATQASKAVSEHQPVAYEALQNVIRERPVLINRAPTLHKYSITAAWPVLTKGHTLQVPPAIVKPLGMDFNGDSCLLLKDRDGIVLKVGDTVRWFPSFEKMIQSCFCPEYEEIRAVERLGRQTTILATRPDADISVLGLDTNRIPDWQRISAVSIHTSHGPLCYRITTRRGMDAVFTAHHNFSTYTDDMRWTEMKTEKFLATRRLVPKAAAIPLFETVGYLNWEQYEFNLDFEFGLFIGYWLGDGSLTGRRDTVTVSSTDSGVLRVFEGIGNALFTVQAWWEGNRKSVRWTDRSLYRFLETNFGTHSFNKRIPDWVLASPVSFRQGLIIGFLEAEATAKSLQTEIANPQLLGVIKVLTESIGVHCTLTDGKPADINRRETDIMRCTVSDFEPMMHLIPVGLNKLRNAYCSGKKTTWDVVPFTSTVRDLIRRETVKNSRVRLHTEHMDKAVCRGYCTRALALRIIERYGLLKVKSKTLRRWVAFVQNRKLCWDVVIRGNQYQRPAVTYDFSVPGQEAFAICGTYLVHNTASYSVPVSTEAVKQAFELMMPEKKLLAARNDKPTYMPSNEYLQGMYFATKEAQRKPARSFKSVAEAMQAFRRGEIKLDDPVRIT